MQNLYIYIIQLCVLVKEKKITAYKENVYFKVGNLWHDVIRKISLLHFHRILHIVVQII